MSNPIPGDDAERAAFEAWYEKEHFAPHKATAEHFELDHIQRSWKAWQARATAPVTADVAADKAEILSLHRRLAAETLRADQGWERYESANRDRNAIRSALAAGAPAETVKAADYEAAKRAYMNATQKMMQTFDGLSATPSPSAEVARDAARYQAWRAALVSEDGDFLERVTASLPADTINRAPTAAEFDAAIDLAAMKLQATAKEGAK